LSDFSKFPQIISQHARILVSPLDWGLGHATRCIPVIEELITHFNARVTVAVNGPQRAIIKEAFPRISYLTAPEYHVKYNKNRAATIARLAFSVPAILKAIRLEASWLESLASKQDFDLIISDNRYGLSHPSIPSILITHQLLVKTPFGTTADRLVQNRLFRLINRFTECWVPDYPSEPSLAGALSHPVHMPGIPVRYIGPLSRLQPMKPKESVQLLVLLSGPEPQRTILESIVLKQWEENPGDSMVMVRGLPGHSGPAPQISRARIYNHLSSMELSQEVANSQLILCRSGYSSVMDLLPLGKKCIMVPTPGQTEQEYLAKHLSRQGRISSFNQGDLEISRILAD
jgi:uncharacterized protein (TIGR00661 family)